MTRKPARQTLRSLDFVTVLPIEECVRTLKRRARRAPDQRLRVRADGARVVVESGGQAGGRGRTPPVWLFRVEADLRATQAGTHVQGAVVRNDFVESWLLVGGLATAAFNVLAAILALAGPDEGVFVLGLALGLQTLFAAYYVYYRRMVRRQSQQLARWVQEWLTRPQGKYRKLL